MQLRERALSKAIPMRQFKVLQKLMAIIQKRFLQAYLPKWVLKVSILIQVAGIVHRIAVEKLSKQKARNIYSY